MGKHRNTIIALKINKHEAYLMACLLTGRRHEEDSEKERERLSKNIELLVRKMDRKLQIEYYRVLFQMDWSKVPKMLPRLKRLAKAVERKDTNPMFMAFMALMCLPEE